MARVKSEGLELLGEGGVLSGLTKVILERALDEELTDDLGYERGDAAGRGSGNSRNGTTPDELGNGVLGEVKNVGSLSYTSQLQDFLAYAQTKGLQFNLYVRGSTTFSGPLQALIDSGAINRIPSLGS
jgi:hypothetical protein